MICQDTDWDGGMGLNSIAEKDNKKQLIEGKGKLPVLTVSQTPVIGRYLLYFL